MPWRASVRATRVTGLFLAIFVLFANMGPYHGTHARAESLDEPVRTENHDEVPNTVTAADLNADQWLLRRHSGRPASELPGTEVLAKQEEMNVEIVRPAAGMELGQWLSVLRAHSDVAYVHPNGEVGLLAAESPNDPGRDKQDYLKQIRAEQAWEHVKEQTSLTIALVDTGVDLDHPDLKANLVQGVNLVRPGKSPEDDNGHGTSVAGVLAAVGNNGVGTTGILWKAKIMPIKALDDEGYGDETRLGEAILLAVNRGAKIVVLSVGLYRYSPYMQDIAKYAESKGVLLVAASGNDGELLGSKANVKYPAAYSTVVAVGGIQQGGKPEPRSNPGTEIDLVASWHVYTTALGGGYKNEEGTSMAAPQVAAAAAMVWAKYPNLKPFEVRERLRQTAKDVGAPGRDNATGNGLLQIDRALTEKTKADAFEPNDSRNAARRLPIGNQLPAQLNGGSDKDWYAVHAPYDGEITIHFQGLTSPGVSMPAVRISHYADGKSQGTADVKIGSKAVTWPVKKGENKFEIQFVNEEKDDIIPYLVTASFRIGSDAYESNDAAVESYKLTPKTQEVTGNFHTKGDRDWYAMTFTQSGALKLSLKTNTVRIDPAFMIQRAGQPETYVDENGDGESEQSGVITITPGTYYIRVQNAASSDAEPVIGTYTLSVDVQTRYEDPNEPNDRIYTATPLTFDIEYIGVSDRAGDQDWFQLRVSEQSLVTVQLSDIPGSRTMQLEAVDKKQKSIFTLAGKKGQTTLTSSRVYAPGTYYFKVTSDEPFDHQYYSFQATSETLVAGYRDIENHWAEAVIAELQSMGIVGGTGNYRFEPDRGISRAEAVAMTLRAFNVKRNGDATSFPDVPRDHWAYSSIAQATEGGIVAGLPDGNFGPNRFITRAEIAVILARTLELKPLRDGSVTFADLAPDHWAAPLLARMKQQGLIGGYPGNTVRPNHTATRAEFSAMIYRALMDQERR